MKFRERTLLAFWILVFVYFVAQLNQVQANFSNVNCSNTGHLATLQITQNDCNSLEVLWGATTGTGWTNNTNWDTVSDFKTWYGLSGTGQRITGIGLNGNKLNGTLPTELGNLVQLADLNVSSNSLQGTIPASFTGLTVLQSLNLSSNQLSWDIPSLTSHASLTQLDFSNNAFNFSNFENQHNAYTSLASYGYQPQKYIENARSITLSEGETLTLTGQLAVNASGNDQYQWKQNGANLTGKTQRALTFTGLTLSDTGTYTYAVTNSVVSGMTLNSHDTGSGISLNVTPYGVLNTINLSDTYEDQASNLEIVYNNQAAMSQSGYLVLGFDTAFAFSGTLASSDLALNTQSNSVQSSSGTIQTGAKTVTWTIKNGNIPQADQITLQVNNLKITNPSNSGSYVLNLSLYDTDDNLVEYATGAVVINNNQTPTAVLKNQNTGATLSSNGTVNLVFDLNDAEKDQIKYEIQVDDDQNFSSPFINDTSDVLANAPRLNQSYQANGLAEKKWYWRVRGIDQWNNTGNWATASNGFVMQYPVAPAPTTSSGGGGGYMILRNSSSVKPYRMPSFVSKTELSVTRPLDFSRSKGKVMRPTEFADKEKKYVVSLEQNTEITTEGGKVYKKVLNQPEKVNLPLNSQLKKELSPLVGIEVGAEDEDVDLYFSKEYTLRIALEKEEIEGFNLKGIKIYYYNPLTKKYVVVGDGGRLNEEEGYIEVEVDHMTTFAVLYDSSAVNVNNDEWWMVNGDWETETQSGSWENTGADATEEEQTNEVTEEIDNPDYEENINEEKNGKTEEKGEQNTPQPPQGGQAANDEIWSANKEWEKKQEIVKTESKTVEPAVIKKPAEAIKNEPEDNQQTEETHAAAPVKEVKKPEPVDNDLDKDGIPNYWEEKNGLNPENETDATSDKDWDGLNNLEEYQRATQISHADSDEDGLSDGVEVNEKKTNPLLADTDGDGLNDKDELENTWTNPLLADTDKDGYLDGSENEAGSNPKDVNSTPLDQDGDGMPNLWEKKHELDETKTADAFEDTDADGLKNLHEYLNGTDPKNADTDGDGVKDGQEVWEYFTNPRAADSDGDGVNDLGETKTILSNPNATDTNGDGYLDTVSDKPYGNKHNSDSDFDGLPDTWEKAHGFNPENPLDAFEDADADGLDNVTEYLARTLYFRADSDADGLTDGEEVKIYHTNPLKPDSDGDGRHDGREIAEHSNPLENDNTDTDTNQNQIADSWEQYREKEESQDLNYVQNIDTDGDGLNDYAEYLAQTDPTKTDTDGDGLSDFEEVLKYASNPNLKDTDGDGLKDNEEVKTYQTNPLLKDTDGDGYTDGSEPETATDSKKTPADTDQDGMPDNWENKYGLDAQSADDASADSDKDGLNNLAEYMQNTDPQKKDSDKDGILDGREVQKGLNPLIPNHTFTDENKNGIEDDWEIKYFEKIQKNLNSQDSDGDGLSDLLEYDYKTNPLEIDTDKDGLSDAEEILIYGSNPLDIESKNDGFKISNLENGIILASSNPTIKGIGVSNGEVKIIIEDLDAREVLSFTAKTSPNKIFLGRPSDNEAAKKSLPDGKYLVSAKLYNQAGVLQEQSRRILIEVNSKLKIEKPNPKDLSGQKITDPEFNGENKIILLDRVPVVTGTSHLGNQIVATWQSIILTSSVVTDSEEGNFKLKTQKDLEIGEHNVTIYAITPDGIRSEEVMIPFEIRSQEIQDLHDAAEAEKGEEEKDSKDQNDSKGMIWLMLPIILAGGAGSYVILKRRQKKGNDLESEEEVEEEINGEEEIEEEDGGEEEEKEDV